MTATLEYLLSVQIKYCEHFMIIQPAITITGKVFDALLPKVRSLPDLTNLELPSSLQPRRCDRAIYDSFIWGTENKWPYSFDPKLVDNIRSRKNIVPPRQYLCRQNKLAGDLCVQLGEFEKAQFYYLKAMRYYARNDPAIWQSSKLKLLSFSLSDPYRKKFVSTIIA
ncbi:hypothetical protein ACTXT7_014768 [Hymenolepis weldensis]